MEVEGFRNATETAQKAGIAQYTAI